MNRIVFATGNKGKIREIREIMDGLGFEIVTMKEAGFDGDIEEGADSFAANSEIKAKAVWAKTGGIVLADDSGLVIDCLGGEPGVLSARYMEGHSYEEKNANLIERVNQAGGARTARFVADICAVLPDGSVEHTQKTMEGEIAEKPAGDGGFGYDPILYLPEYGKTSAEITEEEKNAISHRGKALRAMREILVKSWRNKGKRMKVLIVSDSHRKDGNLLEVIQGTAPFDMMIHLGDGEGSDEMIRGWCEEASPGCEIHMVQGNNDFFSGLPSEEEFMIGPYRTFITHGHRYGVSMGPERLADEAETRGAKIAMFGHTHKPYLGREDGLTVLNPGSISYPRQEGRRPTFAILEIDENGELEIGHYYL